MAAAYLGIKSVAYLISLIEPDSDEGPVQSAWANILAKGVFKGDEYAIETNRRRKTQFPDVTVIEVRDFIAGPAGVDILMVECKRPIENPQQKHFDELARTQSDDQLVETTNSSNFLYGAAAIGRGVKFYRKVTGSDPQPLHDGIHDIATNSRSMNVDYWLQHVKTNAPRH